MKAGDRVQMTPYAISQFPMAASRGTVGTLIRITHRGHYVVKLDGRKTSTTYHPKFFEPQQTARTHQ